MTTGSGYATPAAGQPSYQQAEAAERQRYDREQQRQHWIELGAATLGYHQLPVRQDGQVIAYAWQQRQAEQVNGLPSAVVDRAREALQTEAAARDALLARHAEARQYIARHQLTSAAANSYAELHAAEAATAHRAAAALTPRALFALGQIAERAAQLRAAIASGPRRIAAIEQEAARQIAIIRTDLDAAQLEAMQLGIS